MEPIDLLKISDMYKLAVLDCCHITLVSHEHVKDQRYYGFFHKEEAEPILDDYDSGRLNVSARDFSASIQRVKDRIFESERLKGTPRGQV